MINVQNTNYHRRVEGDSTFLYRVEQKLEDLFQPNNLVASITERKGETKIYNIQGCTTLMITEYRSTACIPEITKIDLWVNGRVEALSEISTGLEKLLQNP